MGSGKMQCWINGPATDGIDDQIKMLENSEKSTGLFVKSMRQ